VRSLIGHAGCVLALMLAVAATVPAAVRAGCRTAPARHSADFAARGALPVGVRTLHLVDATRVTPPNGAFGGAPSRALDTEVWYPAATAPSDMAVQDAPLDLGGAPYPLVLYGHALQDNRSGEAYLAEHLASRGYVVAAVDFPLGKFGAPGGATPDDLASQPGDLTVVLDHLLAGEDGFGGAIDAERIGASGLSLGAATVLLLTYHQDLRDRRIRAALPIAPPYSCAFTRKFYRHARVPLLVMQGDADGLVPLEENSVRVVRRARGPRTLDLLRGGSQPRLHRLRERARHTREHRPFRLQPTPRFDRPGRPLPRPAGRAWCGGRGRSLLGPLPGGIDDADARLRASARAGPDHRGRILRRLPGLGPRRALLAGARAGRGKSGRRHAAALSALRPSPPRSPSHHRRRPALQAATPTREVRELTALCGHRRFRADVQYLLATKFHSMTHGTAESDATRILIVFGFPPMWRSWPVKKMRNTLVMPRFRTRPIRFVNRNMEYCARRLACPRARNVHRRFHTKPLVTDRQKEIVALIHHGVLGMMR